ncbi:hypothetical protein EUA06_14540 [Nocardioides glacieisoli]|uniref:Uncharacterized protein n=1 Tax=Nocardioides glacieisoli TaxID=1168730 RepID=A0A4Q2RQ37_9ACTN|nr:hypothetical protein [Nocardioides glacieisoli]RYB89805.1 hypothetical protein EUA06_14540 [Nocardioides glacieisoli]
MNDGISEAKERRGTPQHRPQLLAILLWDDLDALSNSHNQLCRAQTRSFGGTGRRPKSMRQERQPGLYLLGCDDELPNRIVTTIYFDIRYRLVDPLGQFHESIMSRSG